MAEAVDTAGQLRGAVAFTTYRFNLDGDVAGEISERDHEYARRIIVANRRKPRAPTPPTPAVAPVSRSERPILSLPSPRSTAA
jgi:hypothetical protein